ncbi:MAG: hypothetical protein IKL46_04785 [Clostridia bacterium]|nr:hypothetical protein [Clostridia bacterium]
MAWTEVTPIIPNTTMQMYTSISGNNTNYKITPISGYALHDKGRDRAIYDQNGNLVSITLGFTTVGTTCGINYDFVENPRELYTVLVDELPENAVIYGGGTTPKPEIM